MTRWYQEKKKEYFYKKAKQDGYRARSSFKLKQIQQKFKVIQTGDAVVDLGAAPGGWSQVAKELVGEHGTVVGVDLAVIKPIPGITFLCGDVTKPETLEKIQRALGNKVVDVVLSDMSPNISGKYSVDHARSIFLCRQSLAVATQLLRAGGNFVCKVFMGEDFRDFYMEVKRWFKQVKSFSPPASRKSSSEIYIVAKSFKN